MDNSTEITSIVQRQRSYFCKGETRDVNFRIRQLKALKNAIRKNEQNLLAAVKADLCKSYFETYETEIGMVYEEINYMLRHIYKLARPKRIITPLSLFPSACKIYKEPYGVVLIMSPWNYPINLSLNPLVAAMASGNCAVVKTSDYSPNTSMVIRKLLTDTFKAEYITVTEGGRDVNKALLEQKFDYIFFTGSVDVGKVVMEKASKNLIPVTLELGGKSPCIVDETANVKIAAKRIAWGKCLNAGQTCVAPDYLIIHEKVKREFVEEYKKCIYRMYGDNPLTCAEFCKIINTQHFERLNKLIETNKVIFGGKSDHITNKIEPTLMDNITYNDEIMKDEIFGPILPIITYRNLTDVVARLHSRAKPLALYLFTSSRKNEHYIVNNVSYGGGCINDVIMHVSTACLPFGGIGSSGMGNYHGKYGFETLSHSKSIIKKSTIMEIPIIYPSFKKRESILKFFLH